MLGGGGEKDGDSMVECLVSFSGIAFQCSILFVSDRESVGWDKEIATKRQRDI